MDPLKVEQLLRELSSIDENEEGPSLADEVLLAYRSGRLSTMEAQRLEAILATSAAARHRLACLAGKSLPVPPPALRDRVLTERVTARRPTGWWLPLAGLAAVILMALFLRRAEPVFPPGLTYLVTVRGIEGQRGEGAAGSAAKADAETMVEVSAEPQGQPKAGLRFGLYRENAGRLRLLKSTLPIVVHGHATFRAPAYQFVGSQPGVYVLYLVVANRDLPASVPVDKAVTEQQNLTALGQVYTVRLELRPPSER